MQRTWANLRHRGTICSLHWTTAHCSHCIKFKDTPIHSFKDKWRYLSTLICVFSRDFWFPLPVHLELADHVIWYNLSMTVKVRITEIPSFTSWALQEEEEQEPQSTGYRSTGCISLLWYDVSPADWHPQNSSGQSLQKTRGNLRVGSPSWCASNHQRRGRFTGEN